MKKKIISVIAAVMAVSMMAPAMGSAEEVTLGYKGGSLRLRKGASTSTATVAFLKDGDYIDVLSKGSVWSKVETSDGDVGYIKNLYISGIGNSYADGTTYYGGHKTGTVVTKSANGVVHARAGASTSTASLGTLKNGTKVKVLGENGNWYLVVNAKGNQGYMSKSYIKLGSDSSSSTATYAYVDASALNMRAGAGTGYRIITTLSRNTKVKVLSSSGRWWKVQYGSKTGYMSSNYLR